MFLITARLWTSDVMGVDIHTEFHEMRQNDSEVLSVEARNDQDAHHL
jgi:hypothetical protein